MKFDNKPPSPEKTEIHARKQVEKQKLLFTSVTKHKGHTMWEIDCTTGKIAPAKYKQAKVQVVPKKNLFYGVTTGTEQRLVSDIDCRENCLYIPALNKKSALKKYLAFIAKNMKEK